VAPRAKSEPVEPKQSLVIPAGNTPPELQALRSKRDSFRANLQYAIKQEETYRERFENGDELAELKMLEQRLRVDWYSKKIAEVEQEIQRYYLKRKAEKKEPEPEQEKAKKEGVA